MIQLYQNPNFNFYHDGCPCFSHVFFCVSKVFAFCGRPNLCLYPDVFVVLFLIFIIKDDTDNNEGNYGQLISFQHDSGSNQDDISFGGLSAPPEILARGPRAQQAYVEAAKAGTKKVFRTRLMLVGQRTCWKDKSKENSYRTRVISLLSIISLNSSLSLSLSLSHALSFSLSQFIVPCLSVSVLCISSIYLKIYTTLLSVMLT